MTTAQRTTARELSASYGLTVVSETDTYVAGTFVKMTIEQLESLQAAAKSSDLTFAISVRDHTFAFMQLMPGAVLCSNASSSRVADSMKATILKQVIKGLSAIIDFMFYEGVDSAKLSDGRTIYVYGNGTFEIV